MLTDMTPTASQLYGAQIPAMSMNVKAAVSTKRTQKSQHKSNNPEISTFTSQIDRAFAKYNDQNCREVSSNVQKSFKNCEFSVLRPKSVDLVALLWNMY
jgi:hypothetical protein